MKLLIIGGTGVLSTAVVNEALSRGIEVTLVNRGNRLEKIPAGVELIKSDVRNREYLEKALSGRHFDTVIDFICYTKEQIAYSVALFGNMADQYVFISSACVYDTSLPGAKSEDSPKVLKSWDYSINKWECEKFLMDVASSSGLNYTVIRPCVTYDDTRIPYGIMPPYGYHWTVVSRILNGKPVITWDGGKARWNVMRVEDFAVGVVGLIGNPASYGKAFNVSGDYAPSWSEILDVLGKLLGREVVRVDVPSAVLAEEWAFRAGEISGRSFDAVIDNSAIKTLVPEFMQRISLEQGIAKTLDAYRSAGFQKGIDWNFDAECDRLARKYDGMRGKFLDYLGTATLKDKLRYQSTLHKENLLVKSVRKVLHR